MGDRSPFGIADPPSTPPITHARHYPAGTRLGMHGHAEGQLLFAASGLMQVDTPRGRWLVPPQRAVWLPPRAEHAVEVLATIEMRTLYFPVGWLAAANASPGLDQPFVATVGPLLREALRAACDAPAANGVRLDLLARLALLEAAAAVDHATFLPLPVDGRAGRVAAYLLANPDSVATLADLARLAGASERTLSRLFAAETGLPLKAWRQRARTLRALALLAEGRLPLKAVAARLGFASTAAFVASFRQVMGTTPGRIAAATAGPITPVEASA